MRTLTSRKRIWLAVGRQKGTDRKLQIVRRETPVIDLVARIRARNSTEEPPKEAA